MKDDEFDFGFTAVDENEVADSLNGNKILTLEEENASLKKRLNSIEKMFLPLLQNLAKNPEKPMIKWPNREKLLKEQMDKLLKLTRT